MGPSFPLLVAVTLAIGACGLEVPEAPERAPGPAKGNATEALAFGDMETVAEGLEVPWDLAFLPDDTVLVTERPGRVRAIRGGELLPDPVAQVDVLAEGEGGLMGIAAHPNFGREPFVYLAYTSAAGNRISRFAVDDGLRFGQEEVILDGIPAATFHDGGGLAFGPDGMLYVATGDAQEPSLAADRGSLAGKILRLTPDGAIPEDNPFGGSPVFSFGHRNPQGFDWDEEGRLFASEHGPTGEFGLCCLDEVNLIEAGGFYGWPYLAGTVQASGGDPPQPPVEPIGESGPDDTWAPAGLAVHDLGDRTELYVANLAAQELTRFVVEDGSASGPESVVDELGRVRLAAMGPDGCLYVGTSNRDGRGSPGAGDDRILRACPA
ncbi:MAG: PQQ-dependent sugar dehydrogenase [Actinomycetota bacterium]